MILSINKPAFRRILTPAIIAPALFAMCFKSSEPMTTSVALSQCNRFLIYSYDPFSETNLKKWDITVTPDLFVRFRKTFINGKQEYYSFQIKHFKDINYLGTASAGLLQLKTDADDIIEQTHNDPKGDEDNMIGTMNILAKDVEPERLDSLRTALQFLKSGIK